HPPDAWRALVERSESRLERALREPPLGPAGGSGVNELPDLTPMMRGFMATQLLSIAARLGIADLLADGPRTAAALAEQTSTHPRSLYRFMRAVTVFGIFAELDDERFQNTALSERLRTGVPGSVRNSAIDIGDISYRVWVEALHTIRTGESAAERALCARTWEDRTLIHVRGAIVNRACDEVASSTASPKAETSTSSRRFSVTGGTSRRSRSSGTPAKRCPSTGDC